MLLSNLFFATLIAAADAEQLLRIEYFEHVDHKGNVRIGCKEYHVPSHLSQHIDYITPGVALSAPLKRVEVKRDVPYFPLVDIHNSFSSNVSATSLSHCGRWITPACVKALYNIPDPDPKKVHPQNALGVFEISSEVYDQLDLDLYFKSYAPWIPNGTHPTLVSINNGTAPGPTYTSGGEAILDLDVMYSLVYPQAVKLYQTVTTPIQLSTGHIWEAILDATEGAFCTNLEQDSGADCGTTKLTRVLSTSYGHQELSGTVNATDRLCIEYGKLGLMGHTLVFASGDHGVTGVSKAPGVKINGCINLNDPLNPKVNGNLFNPDFPATCPLIISVGGTKLPEGSTIHDPEVAMLAPYYSKAGLYHFSSGGYFETYGTTYPTYNLSFSSSNTSGIEFGLYNRIGRGYPDLSANGQRFAYFVYGHSHPADGTSVAAPIVASMINMINDERASAGKGPVGFINPVLYANPEMFNDITEGHNPGCGTVGFEAVKGWDPVTGLGTPNYEKMLAVFMALP